MFASLSLFFLTVISKIHFYLVKEETPSGNLSLQISPLGNFFHVFCVLVHTELQLGLSRRIHSFV